MEKNALKGWNNKSILDVGVKICILAFLIVTLFNTIFYEFKINANIKSKREIGAGKIILNLPIKPISMQYPTVSVDEGQYRLQLSPDGTLITTEIIPIGTSLHLDFSYISKEV